MTSFINSGIKSVKKGDKVADKNYLLSCPKCGRLWWSKSSFPKTCPHCGKSIN